MALDGLEGCSDKVTTARPISHSRTAPAPDDAAMRAVQANNVSALLEAAGGEGAEIIVGDRKTFSEAGASGRARDADSGPDQRGGR